MTRCHCSFLSHHETRLPSNPTQFDTTYTFLLSRKEMTRFFRNGLNKKKENSCSRIKYYFFDGKKRSRVANRFISLLLLFERNEQTMGKAGTDKGSREEGEEEGEGERRRSKLGESDIFERSRTVSRRRRRRGREREREGGFAFLPAYVPHEDFFHPLAGFCHRFHDKERGEPLEEIHKDGIVALFVPWPVTRTVPDAFIACHPPAETARKKRKKKERKRKGEGSGINSRRD